MRVSRAMVKAGARGCASALIARCEPVEGGLWMRSLVLFLVDGRGSRWATAVRTTAKKAGGVVAGRSQVDWWVDGGND